MFAIMVFEMRAYFCLREEHPEYCVQLLSPTNHVTLSLNCKMLFLADIASGTEIFPSMNGTDFSNWNLGHTKHLIEPFF
jgi:hypothetical protein